MNINTNITKKIVHWNKNTMNYVDVCTNWTIQFTTELVKELSDIYKKMQMWWILFYHLYKKCQYHMNIFPRSQRFHVEIIFISLILFWKEYYMPSFPLRIIPNGESLRVMEWQSKRLLVLKFSQFWKVQSGQKPIFPYGFMNFYVPW